MISLYAFLFNSCTKYRYNPNNLIDFNHAYEVWMKQIVQNMKSGETQVVDVPVPIIQPGFLLIRTSASLVFAGTERMLCLLYTSPSPRDRS